MPALFPVASMKNPIPYFSAIRLRHSTGQFLTSCDFNYSHDESSKQQAVGCMGQSGDDKSTLWIIKPPHRRDFEKSGSDSVEENSVVRLQHMETGKNLHGHNMKAPVTDQREVTAFGEEGQGNQDDDWIIQSRDGAGITLESPIILKHVQTSLCLHSHSDRYFEAGNQTFQEVTGYAGPDDENNTWTITETQPVETPPVLHPFFRLQYSGGSKTFNTLQELRVWTNTQTNEIDWTNPNSYSGAHSRLFEYLRALFREIDKHAANSEAQPSSTPDFFVTCQKLDSILIQRVESVGALLESDPRREFIAKLREKDPIVATHALAHFLNLDLENSPKSLRGSFRAMCFELGLSERMDHEAIAFEKMRSEKELAFEKIQSSIEGALQSINAHVQNSAIAIKSHETRFLETVDKGRKDFESLKQAYDQEMSLKASVQYWKSKSRWNSILAAVFGFTAAILGVLVTVRLINYATEVMKGEVTQPPHWWEVGTMVIIATFGIWAVRVFIQLMYSNAHLAADASERSTMLLTYLAMIKESVLPTAEEHKLLILQSLFRPGATGVVKDDGSPSTWLDFISNKLGGRN